jgi:hypothetical protein
VNDSIVGNVMRIWDIPCNQLCRKHLLGEHRELHAIWSILTNNKKGYRNHPETKRWEGKLYGLYLRHQEQVNEMKRRGYNHNSMLYHNKARRIRFVQDVFVNTIEEQKEILKNKKCECLV